MKPVALLESDPDLLRSYQERFAFILVDEYQDTNRAQFRLLELLADRHRNLMVVGDDDQSIYGWRGADIRNILDFEKTYPNARVVRLEQNYRSTAHILDAANAVISENTERKGKTLRTERGPGDHIRVLGVVDEMDEARSIVEILEHLMLERPALGPQELRDPLPDQRAVPCPGGGVPATRSALPDRRRRALLRAAGDPGRAGVSAPRGEPQGPGGLRAHRELPPAWRGGPDAGAAPDPRGRARRRPAGGRGGRHLHRWGGRRRRPCAAGVRRADRSPGRDLPGRPGRGGGAGARGGSRPAGGAAGRGSGRRRPGRQRPRADRRRPGVRRRAHRSGRRRAQRLHGPRPVSCSALRWWPTWTGWIRTPTPS